MSRIALVTGGSRGIGAAISTALQAAGYTVAATYAGNDETAAAFTAETGIKTYKWDVSDYDACAAGIAAVEANLGSIDILVNNAGITRDMRERKFGRIINISSINGQKGQFAQANYSAAKAGDIGFTKALAQEGARAGITVNAICPGYIATEMVMAVPEKVRDSIIAQIPAGRLGEASEIARCVVFLASDDAGFITGSTMTANGGQYMT